jgi:hypothetical protein
MDTLKHGGRTAHVARGWSRPEGLKILPLKFINIIIFFIIIIVS